MLSKFQERMVDTRINATKEILFNRNKKAVRKKMLHDALAEFWEEKGPEIKVGAKFLAIGLAVGFAKGALTESRRHNEDCWQPYSVDRFTAEGLEKLYNEDRLDFEGFEQYRTSEPMALNEAINHFVDSVSKDMNPDTCKVTAVMFAAPYYIDNDSEE